MTCFHLAFPCHDFEAAKEFYQDKLGFEIGRQSSNAMIINCGDNQLVAHRCDKPLPIQATIYPRHFGLIFDSLEEYQSLVEKVKSLNIEFHCQPKIRFEGSQLEHHSFFLKDPSNNLLEFKYYRYPTAIFEEQDFKQVGESV